MNYKFFGKIFLCLTLIFGAFVAQANGQGGVTINGSIGKGKIERGKSATVTITMDIPGGLHVNSNRPLSQYAIPTRVKLTGAGLKFSAVNYPRGKVMKFSFSDEQIAVYEGRATFRATMTVPETFKGNVAKIRAVVSYQSCTNEICYRPRSEDITITATVK